MAFKIVVLCAAVMVQSAMSACIGRGLAGPGIGLAGPGIGLAGPGIGLAGPSLAVGGPGLASACNSGVASTGGGFTVTSASAIPPTGVSVISENAIEGSLSIGGNLPLLGSVAVEGAFPTEGAGAVSYGCGDEAIGIATEEPISTGILVPGPKGPGPAISNPALVSSGVGLGGSSLGLSGSSLGLARGPGVGFAGLNGLGLNGSNRGIRGPCGF